MADLTRLAAALDAGLDERVLVAGSPPHDARDLDLLAGPRAAARLEAVLTAGGFTPVDGAWVRLTSTAEVAEVLPTASLCLAPAEVRRLLDDARPVAGTRHVCLPAPPDVLLLLSRRLLSAGGRLDARRLARAREALDEQAEAVDLARSRAGAWGVTGGLELLVAAVEGRPVARRTAVRWTVDDIEPLPGAARHGAWRLRAALTRRPARGLLLAVSGVDGAGKTTQVEQLLESLESLGADPVLLWDRLGHDHVLAVVAALVRRLQARSPTGGPDAEASGPATAGAPGGRRAQGPWVALVVVAHVLRAGTGTRWQLRRGRTVLRDRWTLDSVVHLHDRYDGRTDVAPAVRALRALLPQASRAWLLDVPAEVAHQRKPEQFDPARLDLHRALYLRHAEQLGVTVVDATRPPEESAADLLAEVAALLQQRDRGRG